MLSAVGVTYLLPSFPMFGGPEKKITTTLRQAIFCLPFTILHLIQVEQTILREAEEILRIPITQ